MYKYKIISYLLLVTGLLTTTVSNSQKIVTNQNQTWTQYFFTARVHKNWSLNADAFYRWQDLVGVKLQTGIRGSVTRHFKQPFSLTAGYVYFLHFPSDKTNGTKRFEHRPWQQLTINGKLGRIQVQHRYRFEQRLFEHTAGTKPPGSYDFNFRMRYQLNLQAPINKKEITNGALYVYAFNEIFVNFGKEITYNFYDQNRIGGGLGFQLTKSFATLLGYQYVWQQRARGNQFFSVNCIRLAFVHNLDLRKSNE